MARTAVLSSLSLALLTTAAAAQLQQLPAIVIYATQYPIDATRVGASVTVLEGDKLRTDGIPTVADALRTVPGLTVNHTGTRGSLTEVRMRGSEANHVLVLIDGIEVNALANSGFDFADFPVADVERIEVIRGPQSGIYGSNAHAGVISVITLSGKGLTKPRLDAKVEFGTMHSWATSANVRGANGPFYFSATFGGYETGGYNISRFGTERDGSRAFTGTLKTGIDINEFFNIEGVVRRINRSAAGDPQDFTPGSPTYGFVVDGNTRTNYESLAARVGAVLKLFDGRWVQTVNAKLFDEKLTAFSNNLQSLTSDGTRIAYDYKSTFLLNSNVFGGERHVISVLADHRRELYSASFFPGPTFEKRRIGIAGEYVLDLPTHTTLTGNLRHDWNEPFPNVNTWRLAVSQRFPMIGTRVHASVGRGVTDPDHTEVLGFPGLFPILPNPNVRPESSIGWDLGMEQPLWDGRAVVDVTFFSTDFKDKIEATFVGFNTLFVNAKGTAHRQGIEASAKVQILDWLSVAGTYTYTEAVTSLGVPEIRRPPHSGSIEFIALFAEGRGRATLGAVYNSTRRDIRFNDFPVPNSIVFLPATTILRAYVSYEITKLATVFARAENLLNKRYEEVFSYRAAPFAAYAGLKIRLGE
jgi:vitamin B12 transporter